MLPEDLYILRAHEYTSMRNSRIKRRILKLARFFAPLHVLVK